MDAYIHLELVALKLGAKNILYTVCVRLSVCISVCFVPKNTHEATSALCH